MERFRAPLAIAVVLVLAVAARVIPVEYGKPAPAAFAADEVDTVSRAAKFATGDLLREAVANRTELGRAAQAVMEAGHLVGDDIILGVVREELAKPSAAGGVVFDGVVRTIPQAEGVERLLAERGRRMDRVLFFDVTDEEILGRLDRRRGLEGRADDDPAAVARRLQAYRASTAPVLDWYEARSGVTRIPAVGAVEAVAERVRSALGR